MHKLRSTPVSLLGGGIEITRQDQSHLDRNQSAAGLNTFQNMKAIIRLYQMTARRAMKGCEGAR